MNRAEKLEFIKENYQDLYDLLKEKVKDFVEDVWNANTIDIFWYNACIAFYCGNTSDEELMNQLLIWPSK